MATAPRRSADGAELTAQVIDWAATEAEVGCDVEQLRPRLRRGRPPMGDGAARVLGVRLDDALRLSRRAEAEGVPQGEVVRRALRDYLAS